ncbi:ATP-binding protein [Saccharothrix sp. Mg75]|uniref:ATP-binding protein n=1 Tax=Saccharothrix sp. Mg75 TaxID=3445357 RepID=UPI003EED12DF
MLVRRADGTPVPVGGVRLRALLAVLLVDAGRVVGLSRVGEALYGQHPPAGVVNAVQSQVSRLRAVLDVAVERSPGGYRLVVDPWEVDALRFEELVARGRPGEALALWRGPALCDVGDAPFAAVAAARWEELRLRAVEEHDAVPVGVVRELVAAHPTRERLVARLVRALHREGRRAEALEVFAGARRVLAEELGVDPSPVLAAAHGEVLRDEAASPGSGGSGVPGGVAGVDAAGSGAVRSDAVGSGGSGVRHGLPAQLTSFVGREAESALVAGALGSSRLVTVTGPGGAGKTRLAVEVAGADAGEVVFVDLSVVAAGGDVPGAMAAALGLREGPPGPGGAVARLVAALAERRVLLVVDGCEHVVDDAAAVVGAVLAGCPGVRVLATSREALGITGEVVRPVPPLPVGGAGSAAVRLFADRAAAVSPGFRVEPVLEVVAGICRALDGLPLAIELAAARVRSLPVAEVAARLGDRFRLLSRGSRAAPARHRTLHAVVEWSWGLLSPAERVVARRLAVFADGARLSDAEVVCGAACPEAPGGPEVDELLPSLVEKSLVEVVGDRYRMVETIREFCAARLAEAGEGGAVRRAHAEHFLAVARRVVPGLFTAEQVVLLPVLVGEQANLRAAVRWGAVHDHALAVRLAAELGWPYWLRGLRTEGAQLAAEVVAAVGAVAPPGAEEEHLVCVLNASSTAAGGVAGGGVPVAADGRGFAGPPRLPFLTVLWGMAFGVASSDPPVVAAARENLVGRDPWSRALGRLGAGMYAQYAGDLEGAWREHSAASAGFRAVGERWGTALSAAQLAEVAWARGRAGVAEGFLGEALGFSRELGASEHTAGLLCLRAEWACERGDVAAAWADLEEAVVLACSQGTVETVAAARLGMAEVALLRGDVEGARGWCEEAWRVCPAGWFGPEQVRGFIHVARARVALAAGEVGGALGWVVEAVRAARAWGNQLVAVRAADARARVADARAGAVAGEAELAALLVGAGRVLRGAGGAVPDAEVARRVLGGDYGRWVARGRALDLDGVLDVLDGRSPAAG